MKDTFGFYSRYHLRNIAVVMRTFYSIPSNPIAIVLCSSIFSNKTARVMTISILYRQNDFHRQCITSFFIPYNKGLASKWSKHYTKTQRIIVDRIRRQNNSITRVICAIISLITISRMFSFFT